MVTIHLTGRITEDGKLEVDLPDGLPLGEVGVTIELHSQQTPMTAKEIADSDTVGVWADLGITDSAAFVEELRRKETEERRARWNSGYSDPD
jgi:hypothetical protein